MADDDKASLSALSLSLLLSCTIIIRATAATIANSQASKGQVMIPRHHHLRYHCCQCTLQALALGTAAAAAAPIAQASMEQVTMPRHHHPPCGRC